MFTDYVFIHTCTSLNHGYTLYNIKTPQGNLVPRVFHLSTPEGAWKDPGKEVVHREAMLDSYSTVQEFIHRLKSFIILYNNVNTQYHRKHCLIQNAVAIIRIGTI